MGTDLPPAAASAYDHIASVYDEQVQGSQWMREVLWDTYRRLFRPGQRVLDLCCGTGIDTLHLAQAGIDVVGIDVSAGMIEQLEIKARGVGVADRVQAYVHDVNDLRSYLFDKLTLRQARDETATLMPTDRGESAEPYFDGIISAFAGLSSLPDLARLACEAASLLKPGGYFVVHMLSRGDVWAWLRQVRHGQWNQVLRGRAQATKTVVIGGMPVQHSLYFPHEAYRRFFVLRFTLHHAYSLGCLRPSNPPRWVSPSFLNVLGGLERMVAMRDPFINWGPFFVLEMKKRA